MNPTSLAPAATLLPLCDYVWRACFAVGVLTALCSMAVAIYSLCQVASRSEARAERVQEEISSYYDSQDGSL